MWQINTTSVKSSIQCVVSVPFLVQFPAPADLRSVQITWWQRLGSNVSQCYFSLAGGTARGSSSGDIRPMSTPATMCQSRPEDEKLEPRLGEPEPEGKLRARGQLQSQWRNQSQKTSPEPEDKPRSLMYSLALHFSGGNLYPLEERTNVPNLQLVDFEKEDLIGLNFNTKVEEKHSFGYDRNMRNSVVLTERFQLKHLNHYLSPEFFFSTVHKKVLN